jgi:hypothetical protein
MRLVNYLAQLSETKDLNEDVMNKQDLGLHLVGLLALGLTTTAQATLIDRGNGMIYDSDQNLTWLQDANYTQTSGYDSDGQLTWFSAKVWAEELVYGGYDDWRLPSVVDSGGTGPYDVGNSGTNRGWNVDTSNSELAYMFHINLGNESWINPDGTRNDDGCPTSNPNCMQNDSTDLVDILNLHSFSFWLNTEYSLGTDAAWYFDTYHGYQGTGDIGDTKYAWAVRTGDVAASVAESVPEPGTLVLMLAGLAGIGAAKQRRW